MNAEWLRFSSRKSENTSISLIRIFSFHAKYFEIMIKLEIDGGKKAAEERVEPFSLFWSFAKLQRGSFPS